MIQPRRCQARKLEVPSAFLLTAFCLLPTAYCLLPTAYCLLPSGALDLMPICQRLVHGHFIHILEIAAYRHSHRNTCHLQAERL